jgi:hypothetical protein
VIGGPARAIGIVLASVAVLGADRPREATRAASVYVTVINEDGHPVRGLGGEDFSMRDGSVRQAVLNAEPATEPIAAVVLTLSSGSSVPPHVGAAGQAFAKTLTHGGGNHSVREIASSSLSAADLTRAILDTCRLLEPATTDRRAVVVLAPEPLPAIPIADADAILAAINRAQAAFWTLEGGPAPGRSAAVRPLTDVLAEAASTGGSQRRTLTRSGDFEAAASRIADFLLSQYIVSFQWPNPMLGQMNITTRHDRGTVLMTYWKS